MSAQRLVWVTALVWLTAVILVGRHLSFGASRIDVRDGLLVTHILTAAVALVLGPAQFMPRLRARPRLHRGIGRTYLLAGVLPAGLSGIPLALLTGALAVRAARRRDFRAHRAWMTRNYALTFLAVTSRIVTPLLLVAQLSVLHHGSLAATIPVGQVLGWVINLAVAERILRRGTSVVASDA